MKFIPAIDQGTSGTKHSLWMSWEKCAKGSVPLKTSYLNNGFVEQDAGKFSKTFYHLYGNVLLYLQTTGTVQTILFHAASPTRGKHLFSGTKKVFPLYNAVVWQCKRSIEICERLKSQGLQQTIKEKTG